MSVKGRGNKRMRRVCGKKKIYHSKEEALSASYFLNKKGVRVKPYTCGKHWHLCRQSKEKRMEELFSKIAEERELKD